MANQKFIIEQIGRSSSTDLFVGFIPNNNGTLGSETIINFTASNYANEQALYLATANAIATWANNNGYSGITSADVFNYKPALAMSGYEGTTQRVNAFPIFKTVTISSGVGAVHLTDDGLSTGNPLFPNGVITDSVNAIVSDASASYQMSWAFSNSNKTLTITANKLTTANILTGILGQTQANSSVVKISVWGY